MDDTLNRISELLDKSGMKKIEFLTKLGLSRSAWSAWTSGRADSYKSRLPEIADIFGVSIDWLAGKDQKNKPTISEDDELINLFSRVPTDKKQEAVNYLRYLIEHREK